MARKHPILLAVLLLALPSFSLAQTWLASPSTNDWNTASNWSPAAVPNSMSATAIMSNSSVKLLSLSAGISLGAFQASDYTYNYTLLTNGHRVEFWGPGILPGSGSLTLVGNGLVAFHNAFQTQNYDGLQVVSQAGGQVVFSDFADGGGTGVSLALGASMDISGLTSSSLQIGRLEGAGDVFLGSKNLRLGSGSFSGTLQDGGTMGGVGGSLTLSTWNSVTLTGNNTFSGGVSIENGTLSVGSATALGTGSVHNGDYLETFGGPGTIFVGGDYTQDWNATLVLGLGGTGAGQYDSLDVGGDVDLDGSLRFVAYSGFAPQVGDSFEFLTCQGQFQHDEIRPNNPFSGVRPRVLFLPNSAVLQFIPLSFASFVTTPNQTVLAEALDASYWYPNVDGLVTGMIQLPSSEYGKALERSAPDELSSVFRASFLELESLSQGTSGRIEELLKTGSYSTSDRPQIPPKDRPLGSNPWRGFLWSGGRDVRISGDGNAPGYGILSGGVFLGGADYTLARDALIGLVVGYDHSEIQMTEGGRVEMNTVQGGLYGGLRTGPFLFHGLLVTGLAKHRSRRASFGEFTTADFEGQRFGGAFGAGYELEVEGFLIEPRSGLELGHVHLNGIAEIGQVSPSGVGEQGEGSFKTHLGFSVTKPINLGGLKILPGVGTSFVREWDGGRDAFWMDFPESNDRRYALYGPAIGTEWFQAGAWLEVRFSEAALIKLSYRGDLDRARVESEEAVLAITVGF